MAYIINHLIKIHVRILNGSLLILANNILLMFQILEQGPPLFQQPVLNIICAILKYCDSTSPGLKQFHAHLLRIITSHVKVSGFCCDLLLFLINVWRDWCDAQLFKSEKSIQDIKFALIFFIKCPREISQFQAIWKICFLVYVSNSFYLRSCEHWSVLFSCNIGVYLVV